MGFKPDNLPPDKPRRISIRLPRPVWIGLAGFVLLVGAIGLGFGLPVYRQRVAKDALEKRGAYVESDYRGPEWLGNRPIGIDGREEEWERNPLRKLFYDVTFVQASNYENVGGQSFAFGDSDIRRLQAMPGLKRADLSNSDVTDAGLVHLEGLAGLEELNLSGTAVTDAGIARLKRALPKLTISK